jgi:hypothetical protein
MTPREDDALNHEARGARSNMERFPLIRAR